MNLVPLRAVFFEKRIPQNLPFVKTWQDMEIAKSPAAKPENRQKTPQLQQGTRRKKAAKTQHTSCGTAENMLYCFS